MATSTITALPAGSTPDGTEVLPADQAGSTVKLTVDQILGAARPLGFVNPPGPTRGATQDISASADIEIQGNYVIPIEATTPSSNLWTFAGQTLSETFADGQLIYVWNTGSNPVRFFPSAVGSSDYSLVAPLNSLGATFSYLMRQYEGLLLSWKASTNQWYVQNYYKVTESNSFAGAQTVNITITPDVKATLFVFAGAGGSGATGYYSSSGAASGGGGGGGGGGVTALNFPNTETVNFTLTLTLGAGGAGVSTVETNGQNGGDSSIAWTDILSNVVKIYARGGQGGLAGSLSAGGAGGAGGLGSASTGGAGGAGGYPATAPTAGASPTYPLGSSGGGGGAGFQTGSPTAGAVGGAASSLLSINGVQPTGGAGGTATGGGGDGSNGTQNGNTTIGFYNNTGGGGGSGRSAATMSGGGNGGYGCGGGGGGANGHVTTPTVDPSGSGGDGWGYYVLLG